MTPTLKTPAQPQARSATQWVADAFHNYFLPLLILWAILQGKPRQAWPVWLDLWSKNPR